MTANDNAIVRKRVGIMGGTFDPIHIGHLILGESAYEQFGLDKILFMPSGNPPHKQNRDGRASNEERVEMVRRAICDNEHFKLSLEEMHENGYNYTKETLTRLTSENPDTDYYFIMGADSLTNFETWKDPEEICRLCTILAAVRDHMSVTQLDERIIYLNQKFHADIRKMESLNIDISSGTIRTWVSEGKAFRYYVPDQVIEYIKERKIYKI
ncbi:MAG: nicotinate-nucleotide adenylyltransferase [Lachnospiraceae bacterium]|nr:nicotinate-nucleotide adenylyltransferase [Lachnospiraceae bacterium]MDD3795926.1 nicotinate-nucleotide adenylyltransferase [Lachnospiraceae bacterium]